MRHLASVVLAVLLVSGCMWEAPPPVPIQGIPGQPVVSCLGVPQMICRQMLTDADNNASPGTFVVQARIACTQQPCTLTRGQADANIVYSDGQTSTMGMAWEGPMPAPAP